MIQRVAVVLLLAAPVVAGEGDLRPSADSVGTPLLTTTTESRFSMQDEGSEEDAPWYATVHSGMYFRISGLVIDQLDDVSQESTGDTFAFDPGAGITLAGGYRDITMPLAFEVEYAYRRVELNDPDSSRFNVSTLGVNVLFDASDLIGPVGVYAGGGVGFTIDQVSLRSSNGNTQVGISGGQVYWQAMGGVSVSVSRQVQLYGGMRFSDFGTYEDDDYTFYTEALNYEFGLRIFF